MPPPVTGAHLPAAHAAAAAGQPPARAFAGRHRQRAVIVRAKSTGNALWVPVVAGLLMFAAGGAFALWHAIKNPKQEVVVIHAAKPAPEPPPVPTPPPVRSEAPRTLDQLVGVTEKEAPVPDEPVTDVPDFDASGLPPSFDFEEDAPLTDSAPPPKVVVEKPRPKKPARVVSKYPRNYDVENTPVDIRPAGDDRDDPKRGEMIRKVITVSKVLRSREHGRAKPDKIPPERIVDVLIVFSPSSKFAKGGPRGMLAHAQGVIAFANARYAGAGVGGKLRLVGIAEVDCEGETQPGDLGKLRRNGMSSGCDSTEAIRARVGADFVCFFGSPHRSYDAGLAYVPGAHSVVKLGNGPVFTHELQHNFGWNHPMKDDLSILKKNFPRAASYSPRVMPDDQVYVQYRLAKSRMPLKTRL
jgi:hypothetical protein